MSYHHRCVSPTGLVIAAKSERLQICVFTIMLWIRVAVPLAILVVLFLFFLGLAIPRWHCGGLFVECHYSIITFFNPTQSGNVSNYVQYTIGVTNVTESALSKAAPPTLLFALFTLALAFIMEIIYAFFCTAFRMIFGILGCVFITISGLLMVSAVLLYTIAMVPQTSYVLTAAATILMIPLMILVPISKFSFTSKKHETSNTADDIFAGAQDAHTSSPSRSFEID